MKKLGGIDLATEEGARVLAEHLKWSPWAPGRENSDLTYQMTVLTKVPCTDPRIGRFLSEQMLESLIEIHDRSAEFVSEVVEFKVTEEDWSWLRDNLEDHLLSCVSCYSNALFEMQTTQGLVDFSDKHGGEPKEN